MSDDILNLQPLHPFKATNTNICKSIRYNAIDSHSGVLISVADKEIFFYDTNTYEDYSINSKLRRDISIDFEKLFSINCEFDVSWVEFNCSGSYLLVATISNNNYLNSIKIIDVARTLREHKEVAVCIFQPNVDSKLVDLKWHPCEIDSLLLVLNNSVHICRVKDNELVIMHSKPNAFCVSWSPKGKQFSVIMQKVGSKTFVLNQYDINFVEKRSTEIPDYMNDFKVTFDLVPIEICWYATYSAIIGFRGVTTGNEQFKIFVCRFAIKTSKIQVLSDVRSSSDCINPNPGPCARLYYLHIPDWKAIVLVNNSAEDAVVFEYDSNDDLHTITTYCLPLEGNVVGLSCDYTSNKIVPSSWLPSGFESSGSSPLLFLKLSNGDCFGIYLLHSEKKILNNYNKMFVNSISSEKGGSKNVSTDQSDNLFKPNYQSDVSGEHNQNSFLSQPITVLENINDSKSTSPIKYKNQKAEEITSQIQKPNSQINLFGIQSSNIPASQSNLFGTKNNDKPTAQSNLFGTSRSDNSVSQSNLFGTKNNDKPTAQTNLFGTSRSDVPDPQSNLFGTKNIDKPTVQSNLFGTSRSDVPDSQSNLFGTKNNDKPTAQSNLFGTSRSDVPDSQSNLFGTKNIDKPSAQSNLFGTSRSDVPESQSNLFGTKNIDKPAAQSNLFGTSSSDVPESQSNLFGTKNIDKPAAQSNLFGTSSSDTPVFQSNLFGTKNIDKPSAQSNLFGTSRSDVPESQSNLFGTKNIDKPAAQSNLFGTSSSDTPVFQSNLFGTKNSDKPAAQSNLFGTSRSDVPESQSNLFGTKNIDKPAVQSNLFGNKTATVPEISTTQSPLISMSNVDKNSQHVFLNQNKPSIQLGTQNKVSAPSSQILKSTQPQKNSMPTEIGAEASGNTNLNLSKSNIQIPVTKGMLPDQNKNISQTPIFDTSTVKLPENKINDSKKNLQKSNLEDHDKQNIKLENINTTRQSIKLAKNKNDNKGDLIDNFLPNAIECLGKRINDIKINTKRVIDKSRNLLENGDINKEISKMFHDLENHFLEVGKINMNNKKIIENSQSLCQDIEITLEFTTRFQEAILDSKINHKHFRSAPNPLLKKTSLNLDELANKVCFHLKDLEDALDYVESKRDFKIISKNKYVQLEDIKRTLKSNIKCISVERSKLDLIKEYIDDSFSETIDFPYSHLQTRNVNPEMEKYFHSLMCKRPVNNISCKLPETKQPQPQQQQQPVKNKKIISTPTKHHYNASKPTNEPIKTESKLSTSKPVIIKLVEKDSYKCNQDSYINNETSTDTIDSSVNIMTNKDATMPTPSSYVKEIAPKSENLDPGDLKSQGIKSNELKSKPATINGDSSLKSSSSKDSGVFDASNSKTVPITNFTSVSSLGAILTIAQTSSDNTSFSPKITQSGNEFIHQNALFPQVIPSSSKPTLNPPIFGIGTLSVPSSNIKPIEDLLESSHKTPKSNDILSSLNANSGTNQRSDINLQSDANIQSPSPFAVNIADKPSSSSINSNTIGVGFSSSAFTPSNSSTGLFNIASSSKPPSSGLINHSNISTQSPGVSMTTAAPQSIFNTSTATQQKSDLFGNSNVSAQNTTTQSSGIFGTGTLSVKPNLFDNSSISSPQITTTSSQSFGLFNTPTQTKQSTGLFGSTDTSEKSGLFSTPIQTATPSSIFSSPTSGKPSGGLFGNSSGSTQNSNLFGSSLTSSSAQSTGIFATPASNLSGSSNTSIQNTAKFPLSTTASAQSPFGTPISTKASSGLFGNSNGSLQSTGLFGTAITAASTTTKESSGLFSTPISSKNLFGNPTQPIQQSSTGLFGDTPKSHNAGLFSNSVSKPSQSGGLFGSGTNTTSGGLFGSSQSTGSTNQSTGGLFGNSNQQGTGIFASNNVKANTTQPTGIFGGSSTNNQVFGNATNTPAPTTGLFAQSNTGGLFGNSNTTNQTAGGGSGLFSPSSNLSTTSSGLFGSPSINSNTNEGLLGNRSSISPSTGFFGKNAPTPNSGLFNSSNQTNQQSPSNIFAQPSQNSLFGSNTTGTQGNSTGFSFGGSTMMSGLGSTQSSNNSKNIFGSANTSGSASASVNLFTPKTQSNTSNIFKTDSKPNSLFGNNATSPQTSLFGSRAVFGSVNENSPQTGGLFSNSVFGNNSDSQMTTFGDMATNNVSQSGFGMNSNQPGNIFQTTTSPSFTQRRM